MAFLYFRGRVDFAVLEVGLGGRLDATNIVEQEVSVITSIGMDHQEFLGDTVEAIATEKAGIIKQNEPVVVGPSADLPADSRQGRHSLAACFGSGPYQVSGYPAAAAGASSTGEHSRCDPGGGMPRYGSRRHPAGSQYGDVARAVSSESDDSFWMVRTTFPQCRLLTLFLPNFTRTESGSSLGQWRTSNMKKCFQYLNRTRSNSCLPNHKAVGPRSRQICRSWCPIPASNPLFQVRFHLRVKVRPPA